MPHETTFFQLPCGARACRIEVSGILSGEEARALIQQLQPGGASRDLPCLFLLQGLDSIPSEARGIFRQGGLAEVESWEAVVVTNPVIRVTANFVARIAELKAGGGRPIAPGPSGREGA